VSNPQGLWFYLSDANSIIKQLEVDKIGNCKFENWSKRKKKEITRKINNDLSAEG